MRTFAIITMPYGSFAVTANADGSIPLNAQCVAERDKLDREGNGLRALVDQANAAVELRAALQRLSVALAWATTEERYDLEPAHNAARLLLGRMP